MLISKMQEKRLEKEEKIKSSGMGEKRLIVVERDEI